MRSSSLPYTRSGSWAMGKSTITSRVSSRKRIINIVDSVDARNTGIWNAAIATSKQLAAEGWSTELWFPKQPVPDLDESVHGVPLESRSVTAVNDMIRERSLNPENDIIVTHGCWQYCTLWGHAFSKKNFQWVYVPHGMLEPWAMNQKKIPKSIYFRWMERTLARKATAIRAVSHAEAIQLSEYFDRKTIFVLPNGIEIGQQSFPGEKRVKQYLFLGRLHKKKGIGPLLEGWQKSALANHSSYQLTIAGPDDGELSAVLKAVDRSSNIVYAGQVFGERKAELFRQSTFFTLPSYSEGLPTSALEAMSCHLIPLISSGCNLPQPFQEGFAMQMEPDARQITSVLNQSAKLADRSLREMSVAAGEYVREYFDVHLLAKQQHQWYSKLLANA